MSLSIRNPLHKCATLAEMRSFVKDDVKKAKIDIAQCGGRRLSLGSDSICVKDITKQLDKICKGLDLKKLSQEQQGQLYEILDGIKVINREFATDKLLSKKDISCFQKLMTRIRQFFGNLFFNSAKTCDALLSKMTDQLFKPLLDREILKQLGKLDKNEGAEKFAAMFDPIKELFKNSTHFDYMIPVLKKMFNLNPMYLAVVVVLMLESRKTVVQKCTLLNFLDNSLFQGSDRSEARRQALQPQLDIVNNKPDLTSISDDEFETVSAAYKAFLPLEFKREMNKLIFKELFSIGYESGKVSSKIIIDLGETKHFSPSERINKDFVLCLFEQAEIEFKTSSYKPSDGWEIQVLQSDTHEYSMNDISELLNFMRDKAQLNIMRFSLKPAKKYQYELSIDRVPQTAMFKVTPKDTEKLQQIKEKQNIDDMYFRNLVVKSKEQ